MESITRLEKLHEVNREIVSNHISKEIRPCFFIELATFWVRHFDSYHAELKNDLIVKSNQKGKERLPKHHIQSRLFARFGKLHTRSDCSGMQRMLDACENRWFPARWTNYEFLKPTKLHHSALKIWTSDATSCASAASQSSSTCSNDMFIDVFLFGSKRCETVRDSRWWYHLWNSRVRQPQWSRTICTNQ